MEESASTSLWIPHKMLHVLPKLALITIILSNLCDYLVLAPFMFRFFLVTPQRSRFTSNPLPPGDNTTGNATTPTTPTMPNSPEETMDPTASHNEVTTTPVLFSHPQDLVEATRKHPPPSLDKDDNSAAKKTSVSKRIEKAFIRALKCH